MADVKTKTKLLTYLKSLHSKHQKLSEDQYEHLKTLAKSGELNGIAEPLFGSESEDAKCAGLFEALQPFLPKKVGQGSIRRRKAPKGIETVKPAAVDSSEEPTRKRSADDDEKGPKRPNTFGLPVSVQKPAQDQAK